MKKKNEVYVRVDTPKKAKKLAKVLEMFGGSVCTPSSIEDCIGREWVIEFDEGYWLNSTNDDNKTEVTIKELRNILAVEHLKKGDVLIFGIEGSLGKYIGRYESFVNGYFNAYYKPLDSKESLTDHTGYFDDFIRYATEEEKALLNPKPEIEVGKWYKHAIYTDFLKFYKDDLTAYGFNKYGVWTEWEFNVGWPNDTKNYNEATPQEVEQALIKEAKKRYKVGDILAPVDGYTDCSNGQRFFTHDLIHQPVHNDLWIDNDLEIHTGHRFSSCIFKDGKWAEVVKEQEEPITAFKTFNDKITDRDIATIEVLHDALLDNHGYTLDSSILKNARALTKKLRQLI